jgi:dihydroxyacetone kinase-like protein
LSQSNVDLAKLFDLAMGAVNNNRDQLNAMDETAHAGHGDHVAYNLGLIKSTLESQQSQNPSDALRLAAQKLSQQGQGSTAPVYAQGLQQAAAHFQGQQSLSDEDVGLLLHNMLGASPQSQAPQQTGGMEGILGALSGQTQAAPRGSDLLSKLAPAAMEFMRAKSTGASTSSAAMQAAMRAMASGNPLQASTPGGASGGIIAQSIMKSLLGQ